MNKYVYTVTCGRTVTVFADSEREADHLATEKVPDDWQLDTIQLDKFFEDGAYIFKKKRKGQVK